MKKFLAGISLMGMAEGMIVCKLFGYSKHITALFFLVGGIMCLYQCWKGIENVNTCRRDNK